MANSKACKSLKRPPVVSRALCSRLVDFAFSLNLVTSARSVTDVFWVTVSRDGVESGCRRGVDRPSLAIFYRPLYLYGVAESIRKAEEVSRSVLVYRTREPRLQLLILDTRFPLEICKEENSSRGGDVIVWHKSFPQTQTVGCLFRWSLHFRPSY